MQSNKFTMTNIKFKGAASDYRCEPPQAVGLLINATKESSSHLPTSGSASTGEPFLELLKANTQIAYAVS
jgi:hypothetical protein